MAMAVTGAFTPPPISTRVVAATIAGNAIEFYDFLCFSRLFRSHLLA